MKQQKMNSCKFGAAILIRQLLSFSEQPPSPTIRYTSCPALVLCPLSLQKRTSFISFEYDNKKTEGTVQMESERDFNILDFALPLLDIIVIMLTDENPVNGVILLVLLKAVTNDPLMEILFMILAIVLWVARQTEEQNEQA